jgi:hypothetical protein
MAQGSSRRANAARSRGLIGCNISEGDMKAHTRAGLRECHTCKKLKPISEFRKNPTSNYYPRDCLQCNREYRASHKPPPPTRPKPLQCEICKSSDRISNDHGYLSAGKWVPRSKHPQGTKTFRGWVCKRCNDIIGRAEDSPELLEAVAAYLTKQPVS